MISIWFANLIIGLIITETIFFWAVKKIELRDTENIIFIKLIILAGISLILLIIDTVRQNLSGDIFFTIKVLSGIIGVIVFIMLNVYIAKKI